MTTDYKAGVDDDFATEQAQKAASSSIDGFVERMAERIGAKASVRAVFGEPIERDGITVVPVARVRWWSRARAGRSRAGQRRGRLANRVRDR
jgi:hypothetical protein